MEGLAHLQPPEVWGFFREILAIPRPSKREGQIIAYLQRFAGEHALDCRTDDAGNVLIAKRASPGMGGRQPVVLQSHLDMVCEKDRGCPHDFHADPIRAFVDEEWVRAQGTTLGADDGIGIAAQLAILSSPSIAHGSLECLFTVDEETGLTGAHALMPNFFRSAILINLDSEDEGELFIGCAGGMDTEATFYYHTERVPSDSTAFKLTVSGLRGGHSGDDIHRGLGNAIKILTRMLWQGARQFDLRLAAIDGGNLRNAIPREAEALFTVHTEDAPALLALFDGLREDILAEWAAQEPGLTLAVAPAALPAWVIDEPTHFDLLNALYACPHGVIAMSSRMPGLVETSTNLASVKQIQDQQLLVTTSQRSSVDSAKVDVACMVESVFRLANASVVRSSGYPGWTPRPDSPILGITRATYQTLFGVDPVVRAVHAGLECGLFLEKYPGLDMISFGPTIRGAHSPSERLHIPSVERFWRLLLGVLRNVP